MIHLQAHAAYYGHHYANNQSVYNETSYNWVTEQLNKRIQQLEADYQNATGGLGKKTLRETADMLKNWTKELEESIRHICDPNTAKAGDKDGWKAIESAKVTDAILTKYAEQYGLNKEYLSKNRHLISYFAQLEKQAKNPQPPNRLSIQIFSGLMGAIATGLGGPTAGFTTYGALNSGLTSHFINRDDGWTVLGKTILGGVTGGLAGASLAKIGAAKLGFLAKTLLESGTETLLDTGISVINGDEITVGSVLSNFGLNTVINGGFNGLDALKRVLVADFKINPNAKTHLSHVENISGKTGISGGHNKNELFSTLEEINGKVLNQNPHPDIEGIYEIRYTIPQGDGKGGYLDPVTYPKNPNKYPVKTVYDPTVFSDEKMYQLGLEAMQSGKIQGDGVTVIGVASNGLSFSGYLRNGEITNFHPIFPK